MRRPRYNATEITDKSPEAKSTYVASWKRILWWLNGCELSTRAYHANFGIKLSDQEKDWVPHMVCKACTETLRGWTNGKKSLNFEIPMVWRESTNHVTDCYFCAVDVTGINRKDWGSLKYIDLQSARRPVPHCDEITVPIFEGLPDISDEDASSVEAHEQKEDGVLEDDVPHPFSQKEVNDIVRDLSLSTDFAELSESRLNEKKPLLSESVRISLFCNRYQAYIRFFLNSEGLGVLCRYWTASAQVWSATVRTHKRLFIDSSK